VLIYDQTCAAEKRRRRKRGRFPDPDKRVIINELVCEGCGDCGVKSNCVSVQPLETEWGRKRTIDQSSCNKDFSCVKGFCPSFVTVYGAKLRQGTGVAAAHALAPLPEAKLPTIAKTYDIIVTGVGGTGIVTIGGILGMAAHLSLPTERLKRAILADAGRDKTHFIDATRAATALFGNSIGANIFLVGYAYQLGAIPLSAASITQAIELNGEAVEMNQAAFHWGRRAACAPAAVEALI